MGKNRVDETTQKLLNLSRKEGLIHKLRLVPEDSINNLNKLNYCIIEDRDSFDYIYNAVDLYHCNGKRFEAQRNLLNRFCKKYSNFEIKLLPINFAKKEILQLSEEWRINKMDRSNQDEFKNVTKSLARIFHLSDKNLFVICVFHENRLIAYAIDEMLDSDYALCHFAKADTKFSGVYSFLMKQNCESLLTLGKKFLNYEQDLGLSNLRCSKNAFRPIQFLKKFSITTI